MTRKATPRTKANAGRRASRDGQDKRAPASKASERGPSAVARRSKPSTLASPEARLRALRKRMDVLNLRLADALTRRVRLARTIGRTKAQLGLAATDPQREQQMLAALKSASDGELPPRELERVFRAVFRVSRAAVLADRRRVR